MFHAFHTIQASPFLYTAGTHRRGDNQNTLDEHSVFISYCPVGFRHRKFNKQLCRLAEFLQNQGYLLHFEPNCQAQIRSFGGVVHWKEACIKKSKNILVICTSEYYNEDSKTTELGGSRKASSSIEVDSRLLRQLAYSKENSRIIPVLLDGHWPSGGSQVPMWLQPLVKHSWPSGQTDLDLCLRDLPRYVIRRPDPSRMKRIEPKVIDYPRARKHKC